jgi:hypothetical protein
MRNKPAPGHVLHTAQEFHMKSQNIPSGLPAVAPADRSAINRENARHSTGPRTESGKQRSSLNALRHGLTGHTVVLPSEDLSAYRAFTKCFFDDFQPKGAVESQLVQSIADSSWRLNRACAIETNLLTLYQLDAQAAISTGHPEADAALGMAHAWRNHTHALATLSLLEQRLSRQFEKALKQLRELQAERRRDEDWQLGKAAELLQMHKDKKLPYHSAEDGFVFSNDEIETHIHRQERLKEASHARYVRAAT